MSTNLDALRVIVRAPVTTDDLARALSCTRLRASAAIQALVAGGEIESTMGRDGVLYQATARGRRAVA